MAFWTEQESQKIIEENDSERIRNHRISWFNNNFEIKSRNREALKNKLSSLCVNESYLAEEAYDLMASGDYDVENRTDDKEFLSFMIDMARDKYSTSRIDERGKNHFA